MVGSYSDSTVIFPPVRWAVLGSPDQAGWTDPTGRWPGPGTALVPSGTGDAGQVSPAEAKIKNKKVHCGRNIKPILPSRVPHENAG